MKEIMITCKGTYTRDYKTIIPFQGNLKETTREDLDKLKSSIIEHGFSFPEFIWENDDKIYTIDAHRRNVVLAELEEEGYSIPPIPVCPIYAKDEAEAKKKLLLVNSHFGRMTIEGMVEFTEGLDLDWDEFSFTDFDMPDLFIALDSKNIDPSETDAAVRIRESLADRFLLPPFSVLDTRSAIWQERKQKWNTLFESYKGRGEEGERGLLFKSISGGDPTYYKQKTAVEKKLGRNITAEEFERKYYKPSESILAKTGTSIFDPVLAEVLYKWFCPVGGTVLDPFAGGSVRGIVAGFCGLKYHGVDLSEMQVQENKSQEQNLVARPEGYCQPHWYQGDSTEIETILNDCKGDMLLSCPPYADLEVYSNDPRDISNMKYEDFRNAYRQIIKNATNLMVDHSFAVFVVGEVRDKNGLYYGFTKDTIEAFQDAGLSFYNEMVLINMAGTLAVRAGQPFMKSRKVGKQHQNVFTFVKGSPQEAAKKIAAVEKSPVILVEEA